MVGDNAQGIARLCYAEAFIFRARSVANIDLTVHQPGHAAGRRRRNGRIERCCEGCCRQPAFRRCRNIALRCERHGRDRRRADDQRGEWQSVDIALNGDQVVEYPTDWLLRCCICNQHPGIQFASPDNGVARAGDDLPDDFRFKTGCGAQVCRAKCFGSYGGTLSLNGNNSKDKAGDESKTKTKGFHRRPLNPIPIQVPRIIACAFGTQAFTVGVFGENSY